MKRMKYALPLLLLLVLCFNLSGQEQLNHHPALYVDSNGQVYTQSNQSAYFFVSSPDDPNTLTPVPTPSRDSILQSLKKEGVQYISQKDSKTGKTILYRVITDDTPPETKIDFTDGLIFAKRNHYYVELGAPVKLLATDKTTAVRETLCSINGSPYHQFEDGHPFLQEGEFLINIYSVDMVGNVEQPKTFWVTTSAEAVVPMDNIYFDYNSANLRPESKAEIDTLVYLMNKYPKIRIELRAHTDSRGESRYNIELSNSRANAVVAYMVNKGIDKARLGAKGFGDSVPINECVKGVSCSEEKHRQNRRVEFVIFKVKD